MVTRVSTRVPVLLIKAAPAGTCNWRVPTVEGVTWTVNTPGVVSATELITRLAEPALLKSAAVTDAASMSSLKVTV